jgi:hypothetical protein
VYYWYYATLALFQVGGEPWAWWNERYRDFAVGLQRRDGCSEGSWDPVDNWLAPYGGRLYATSLNLLSLEVYYRYLPLYRGGSRPPFFEGKKDGEPETAGEEDVLIAADQQESSGRRLRALQALEKVRSVGAHEACVKALEDPNAIVRWQAAKSLGARREQESVPALVSALSRGEEPILPALVEALGRIGGRHALLAVAPFIAHASAPTRAAALQALRNATGADHGSDLSAWLRFLETYPD